MMLDILKILIFRMIFKNDSRTLKVTLFNVVILTLGIDWE